MGNRFVVLTILTGMFQLICIVALMLGLFALFGDHRSVGDPNDPFAQIPPVARALGGAVLALYGLTGLVFSGGINVLISIDENTHSLKEQFPAAIAALREAAASVRQTSAQASPRTADLTPPEFANAPIGDAPASKNCPSCDTSNDLKSQFCENCGTSLH